MYMIQDSDGKMYPADRCVFQTSYSQSDKSYVVNVGTNPAVFYPGNAAAIPLSTSASARPVLGYIGKSGRFVDITHRGS